MAFVYADYDSTRDAYAWSQAVSPDGGLSVASQIPGSSPADNNNTTWNYSGSYLHHPVKFEFFSN